MRRLEKVSPPFEGGVAGIIDYLMFTEFFPGRGGWFNWTWRRFPLGIPNNTEDGNRDKYL